AVVVEVDALAGGVGAEQDANLALLGAEVLGQRLLLLIAQGAVEQGGRGLVEAEAGAELLLEKAQGVDALGEDHHPLALSDRRPAELLEQGPQPLELAEVFGGDR